MNDKSGIKDPAGRPLLFLSFANIRPLRKADKAVRSALWAALSAFPLRPLLVATDRKRKRLRR